MSTLIAFVSLALAVSAFGSSGGTSATTNVAVTAGKPTEFKFMLSKKTVKKGTVVFKVANRGTVSHDFKIAGKKTRSLASNRTASLKVVFKKAGKVAFLCTLPGHAAAGMKGTLTVK